MNGIAIARVFLVALAVGAAIGVLVWLLSGGPLGADPHSHPRFALWL